MKSDGATNSVGSVDQGFVGHAVAQILAAALSGLVSHNRVGLLLLAVARVCPSGLKTAAVTPWVWPVRVVSRLG